ncbi:MAG: DUF882 domain-containing protein [Acidobacteria bacterium]|nr:DUF882 domain-containing protein [Acidobacteriota bacterium]
MPTTGRYYRHGRPTPYKTLTLATRPLDNHTYVNQPSARRISRRSFVTALAAARSAFAGSAAPRALRFNHLHTGERLEVEYFSAGTYQPDALHAVDRLLRDFRTGDVHPINPDLLDLLHNVTGLTESRKPFDVISGYRSPATNQMLRRRSEGVAAGSLHMQGLAIDIHLADVPLPKLRDAALTIRRGGVGYYPASNFVHVDTGRVRTW